MGPKKLILVQVLVLVATTLAVAAGMWTQAKGPLPDEQPPRTQKPLAADKKRVKALEMEREKLTKRLAEIDAELGKLIRPGKDADVVQMVSCYGVSPDLTTDAMWAGGLKLADLTTGRKRDFTSWDGDWGFPARVAFGHDVIAVTTGLNSRSASVKIFSRDTLELQRNIRAEMREPPIFSSNGRILALAEYLGEKGYCLVLRDVQAKKSMPPLPIDGIRNGEYSLAVAGKYVAAYSWSSQQVTVAEAETGMLFKKFSTSSFRKKAGNPEERRMPFAISSTGMLAACGADDAVVIYGIGRGKVVRKLEGHLDVVSAVALSPGGDVVASGGKDKTIHMWNVDGKAIRVLKDLPGVPTDLSFSSDGKRIMVMYRNDRNRRAEIRPVN